MAEFSLRDENEDLYLVPGFPPLLKRGDECSFLLPDGRFYFVDGLPAEICETLRNETRECARMPRGRPPGKAAESN